eukprot:4358247-Prymnesium_polylepis.1
MANSPAVSPGLPSLVGSPVAVSARPVSASPSLLTPRPQRPGPDLGPLLQMRVDSRQSLPQIDHSAINRRLAGFAGRMFQR